MTKQKQSAADRQQTKTSDVSRYGLLWKKKRRKKKYKHGRYAPGRIPLYLDVSQHSMSGVGTETKTHRSWVEIRHGEANFLSRLKATRRSKHLVKSERRTESNPVEC
jgi:hypothetical protein